MRRFIRSKIRGNNFSPSGLVGSGFHNPPERGDYGPTPADGELRARPKVQNTPNIPNPPTEADE